MRVTRSTSSPRACGRRRIGLGVALVSGAALLAAAFVLHAPTRVRGSDTAEGARLHKVTESTPPRSVDALDVAGPAPSSATAAPTTTTLAPVPTVVSQAPTAVPRTTPTAPPAPPVTTTTAPPTGVSPEAACNAKLAELRAQGWDQGTQLQCSVGLAGSYTANVSNGTMGRQIIAYADGSVSVS